MFAKRRAFTSEARGLEARNFLYITMVFGPRCATVWLSSASWSWGARYVPYIQRFVHRAEAFGASKSTSSGWVSTGGHHQLWAVDGPKEKVGRQASILCTDSRMMDARHQLLVASCS